MDNIFDTNNLYPDYKSILKDYFRNYFDSVFICFNPFFTIRNDDGKNRSVKHSKMLSLDELIEINSVFKKLDPSVERVYYTNDVPKYPSIEEIIERGTPAKWEYLKTHGKFKNYAEINIALRTSIGGLSKQYARPDLQLMLDHVSTENSLYNPSEGRINPISLLQIYECLKALNKYELVVTDEFFEDRKRINLSNLSGPEFVSQAFGYMYYFPIDRSLLFTIEWDSFFYLICGNQVLLDKIIPGFGFDGFYANNDTTHSWEFE